MHSSAVQARHSNFVRQSQKLPVLRPHMLSGQDGFVAVLSLAAGLPRKAPVVVAELERYQKSYVLDSTLSTLLRKAKATVNRGKALASVH